MLTALTVLLAIALWLVAITFAIRAVLTARTPQGAAAWVVFLLAAPHFAVPAYLFFGQSRLSGYVLDRRELRKVIAGAQPEKKAEGALDLAPHHPNAPRILALERMAEAPVVAGNSAELLIDGAATFDAIFAAIEASRSYVLIAFYIVHDDDLGRELKKSLIRRAEAGIAVRFLYDAIGSVGLPGAYLAELRAAGVDIRDFHSIRRPRNRFQINFRNHRKILIIDGEVGFLGGLNAGDEYMGRDARFGHWRDTHLKLLGPAVAQLQMVIAEDWHWASGEALDLNWSPPPQPAGIPAMILAAGPADPVETGSLYFCNLIGAATERLWIASPYFVPDVDTLTALKLAAYRGVDVRILLPEKRDHLVVWLAAFAYFDEVRAAGVAIWRYRDGFMHQKVVVVDDHIASVGTLNLDIRSCRLNFEVTALLFDVGATGAVTAMLEADFGASTVHETPLRHEPLWIRLGAPVARLFAPVL